jgi:hypothetical protein
MTAYRVMTAGDKYCSESCYEEAGKKYFTWRSVNLAWDCEFCHKALTAGSFGYDPDQMALIFTWQNQPMFVCGACARQGKAKQFFDKENKCCTCGQPV